MHIRVFLSSPGDVTDERAITAICVDRLRVDPFIRGRVTIELVAWDEPGGGAPLLASTTPQASINAGLPRPSQCDIVVVIFWSRTGTPLPFPEYQRPDGTPYESGTVWEMEDGLAAARNGGRPAVLVYRRATDPMFNPRDPDFENKVAQLRRLDNIFLAFRDGQTGAIRQAYSSYDSPDDFRALIESDLRALVQRLSAGATVVSEPETGTAPQPRPSWRGSPFPGLRSFTPADAPLFFGRGRETDQLATLLAGSRFVAVVGASGSGKSSLVGAGLIPRLAAANRSQTRWNLPSYDDTTAQWAGVRFTPGEFGDDPFIALAARIAPLVAARPRDVADRLRADTSAIADVIAGAGEGETLVFIDQFEELFTIAAPAHREPFSELLAACASSGHARVVVTVRADHYARCVESATLARLFAMGQLPLSAPTETLLEMIVKPAELAGLELEEGLVGRLLRDTGDDPGALPLLAYALDQLFRTGEADHRLDLSNYEAMGGVQGAIGARAEAVLGGLRGDDRASFERIFRELVEIDDEGRPNRRRARVASPPFDDAALDVIEHLTEARLLVQDRGTDDAATVFVAHEALFQSWPSLRELIEVERDDLALVRRVTQAAAEWDASNRDETYLWPHERLQLVYDMRSRINPRLDAVTTAFIEPEANRALTLLIAVDTPAYRKRALADRLVTIGPSTVAGLVQALGTDQDARDVAVSALSRLGPAAVAGLEPAVTAFDPDVRLAAVLVLRSVGGPASTAHLVRLVADDDERVRSTAVGALASIGDDVATTAMVRALADARVDVRWQAVGALGAAGPDVVPALMDMLIERDDGTQRAARDAILAIGPRAVDELAAQLRSADIRHRELAATLLVTVGQPSVRALVTLASEQDRDTEWRILGALALIGDAAGLPRVLSAARSAEPALRAAAYRALRTVADESAIPVLVQGLAEDDSDVRTDAAAALARLGSSSRAAARQATLDAGSTWARSAACAALAHNEAGIGTLAELLADQNPAVRFHAELALSACTDRAVPALRELLAAPVPAQRNAALRILSAIGSSAVPTLVAATGSTDEFVAVKAVDALAAVRAPGVKQELLRLIGSAAPQIRNRAAAALCARGDDVLDALLRRLSSDNPQLRAAAADALVFVGGRAVPQVLSLARHGANGRREEAIALLERLPGPAAVFAASQLRWSRSHRSDASEDQPE